MRRWELTIALDPKHELPIFLQLANAIAGDIRSGRLKAGEPLPGTRELAQQLSINRNTVVAGYEELVAEGLVSTRVGGGTFVATPMHTVTHTVAPTSDTPTYPLAAPASAAPSVVAPAPGTLFIANGLPDTRLFPAAALTRAFRRAIAQRGHSLLGYADPCGHRRLREELANMLGSTRGLPATPDCLMVTRSLEQAIDLVARMLLRPGDVVAVEAFGYPPAWNMLSLTGATLIPVPLDENGLDVEALEALLSRQSIRAVFLTPHHQFPTTSVMSQQRRARLAQLALSHGFAIIEDDYDHEFHYAGKPVLPIASGPGRANVIYIGSLANLLAPGISTGFVLAPPSVFTQLASLRATSDARSDVAMESAIAELFEDGELLRHVRRMRRVYGTRRDALVDALTRHLGGALRFRIPEGGMGLWARVDDSIDLSAWIREGARHGVQLLHGKRYDFQQREQPYTRLGFSYLDEKEIDEAVRRMAHALPKARKLAPHPFRATPTLQGRA
ncbi:PLP-dependent aminotransferase family protein [Dyella flava]|uniref:PLP-dependent aminotransferase family protein n=1 Tax=Dyella flava TaxID=1920170 RepID=A0ABS2JXW6_9GAMM|nr:PLP-dependent aminotransferase family protein [Dyella flava]MBM7123824.1 PLP-dependent aminotransferase family protein [Dyella flava]GLQ52682.1 GntR family transcriptional regulator [Dyella flava]